MAYHPNPAGVKPVIQNAGDRRVEPDRIEHSKDLF